MHNHVTANETFIELNVSYNLDSVCFTGSLSSLVNTSLFTVWDSKVHSSIWKIVLVYELAHFTYKKILQNSF